MDMNPPPGLQKKIQWQALQSLSCLCKVHGVFGFFKGILSLFQGLFLKMTVRDRNRKESRLEFWKSCLGCQGTRKRCVLLSDLIFQDLPYQYIILNDSFSSMLLHGFLSTQKGIPHLGKTIGKSLLGYKGSP